MGPVLVNGPNCVSCHGSTPILISAFFMLGSAWCVLKTPAMKLKKKKSVKPGGCGMNRTVTMARQMSTQEQNTGGYFDKSSNWDQQTATNTTEFHTCQITRVLWGNWCGWKEYEPGNQNDEPEVSVCHFTGDVIWLLGPSKLVPFPQRGNNCSTLLEVGVIKAWSSVVIEPDHLMLPVEKLRLKAR